MTEQREPDAAVPEFDLADRMRKSLRHGGVTVAEMADYLGVSRQSVGNWIGGRIEPDIRTLRLWALRAGVPYPWLCHGTLDPCVLGPRAGSNVASADDQGKLRLRPNNMHYSQTRMAS